jgi:type I restriction enzyme S subunit
MYEIKYRDESDLLTFKNNWFTEIACDWKLSKFKYISTMKTGNSINAIDKDKKYSVKFIEYYNYIGTKDINVNTNIINYENDLFIPLKNKFKIAKRNSSLICIEGGSAGRKLGYLNKNVCYGNKLCNIITNRVATNKLVYYILQSRKFVEQINLKMTGIIPGISVEELKNIVLILPQIDEQQKIANFLDIKTAQFDNIILKKEQLIKKLEEAKKSLISEVVTGKVKIVDGKLVERNASEMKDSGVEWLGMVPEEWELTKVKYELKFYNYKRIPLSSVERGKMVTREYDYYGASGVIDKVSKYIFDGRYILVGEDGANLYSRNTDLAYIAEGKFWVNNHAHILRAINGHDKFYSYLLESVDYYCSITGSAQPKLTQDNLAGIIFAIPFDETQDEIVEFIEYKLDKANKLLTNIRNIVMKLKQAKQALISESVTGKIDLRDWEIIEEGDL